MCREVEIELGLWVTHVSAHSSLSGCAPTPLAVMATQHAHTTAAPRMNERVMAMRVVVVWVVKW